MLIAGCGEGRTQRGGGMERRAMKVSQGERQHTCKCEGPRCSGGWWSVDVWSFWCLVVQGVWALGVVRPLSQMSHHLGCSASGAAGGGGSPLIA